MFGSGKPEVIRRSRAGKAPDAGEVPLWLRHPDRTWWFEYLADTRTLYVCHRSVAAFADGETNQAFLLQILDEEFFRRGETFTTTLESRGWKEAPAPEEVEAFAKMLMERSRPAADPAAGGPVDRFSPWRSLGGFRMGS